MFHVFREFPKHLAMWLDVCCGNSMHDIPGLAHLCPEQRTATGSSSCTVLFIPKAEVNPIGAEHRIPIPQRIALGFQNNHHSTSAADSTTAEKGEHETK